MPKEIVYSRYAQTAPTEDVVEPFVHVGWTRDARHVEVATVMPDTSRELRSETPNHYGWHVQLDRDGINDLIHRLRKARDSAFGKDA